MSGYKLKTSPLAPAEFPDLPVIEGVDFITGSMGMYGARDDLLAARFPDGASVGGVFTRSLTRSADVDWCRAALQSSGGKARVLVVNAGNSNAFTGQAGIDKNAQTVKAASALENCAPHEVYVAATGVIGEPMQPDRVANKLRDIWPEMGRSTLADAGRAFMTTDTFAKASSATSQIDGVSVKIAGVTKGSGMIAPNMATMLGYVFTDANLSPGVCQSLLSRFADLTFNCITVDGDTSTSDSLMLFATGKSGGPCIEEADDPRLAAFSDALLAVLKDLALQIVRDGEGASKLIEIEVTGAVSEVSAKAIASEIANSPLVKTALAASDANWGRIVMAVGKSGEQIERDKLSIRFGDVVVARDGMRAPNYSEAAASAQCARSEIAISVDVGVGDAAATVWTCDLTHGYVDINGSYRT